MSVCWDSTKGIDEPKVIPFAESLLVLGKLLSDPGCDIMLAQDISLRDMILLKPLELPCRGLGCKHIQCFDFKAYLHVNSGRISSAYMCPICNQVSNPSKIYVDSIFLCLMKILPEDANVSIVKDGTFEVTSTKPALEVINIDDSDDDDVLSSSSSSGFHGNKTVGSIKELAHIVKYTIAKSKTKQTSLQELSTASLDDVLHLMNVDTAWGVGSIPNITETLQTCIREKRPYVCSTRNSLCHALQAVEGVGDKRATRIVDHFYSILQNKLTNFLKFVADRSLFKSTKQLNTLSSTLVVDFLKKNGALKLISATNNTNNDDTTSTAVVSNKTRKLKSSSQTIENEANPPSKKQRSDSVISVSTATSTVESVQVITNYSTTTSPCTSSSSISHPACTTASPMKPSISAGRAKSSSSICGEGIADVARPPRLHRSVSIFSVESENSLTTREASSMASNPPGIGRPPVSSHSTASPVSTSRRLRRERGTHIGLSSPTDSYASRPSASLNSPSSSATDPIDVDAEAAACVDDAVSVSSSSVVVVRPGRQGRKRRLSLSSITSAQSPAVVHTTTERDDSVTIVSAASSSSSVSQTSHNTAPASAPGGGLQLAPRLAVPQATPAITVGTGTKHNGAVTIIVPGANNTSAVDIDSTLNPAPEVGRKERSRTQSRTPQKAPAQPVSSPGGANARKNSISSAGKSSASISSSSSSSSNMHIRFDDALQKESSAATVPSTTPATATKAVVSTKVTAASPRLQSPVCTLPAASSAPSTQPDLRNAGMTSVKGTAVSGAVSVSATSTERTISSLTTPTPIASPSPRSMSQTQSQQHTATTPTSSRTAATSPNTSAAAPMSASSTSRVRPSQAPAAAGSVTSPPAAKSATAPAPATTTVSRGLATVRAARNPTSSRTLPLTASTTLPGSTNNASHIIGNKRERFEDSELVSGGVPKASDLLKTQSVDVRSRDYSQKDFATLKEAKQSSKVEGELSSSTAAAAAATTRVTRVTPQSGTWKPPLPPGPPPVPAATTVAVAKAAAPMRFVPRLLASTQGPSVAPTADLRSPPSSSGQYRENDASFRSASRSIWEDKRDFGQYRERDMAYSGRGSSGGRFPREERWESTQYRDMDVATAHRTAGRSVWDDRRGSVQYRDGEVAYRDRREERWDGRRSSRSPPDCRQPLSREHSFSDRYEQRGYREDCTERRSYEDRPRSSSPSSPAFTHRDSNTGQSLCGIKQERPSSQPSRHSSSDSRRDGSNISASTPTQSSSTGLASPGRSAPTTGTISSFPDRSSEPQRQTPRFPENPPPITTVSSVSILATTDQHKPVASKSVPLLEPVPHSARPAQRIPENPPVVPNPVTSPVPYSARPPQRIPENPPVVPNAVPSPASHSAKPPQCASDNPPAVPNALTSSSVPSTPRPAERQQQHIRFAQDLSPYLAQFDSLQADQPADAVKPFNPNKEQAGEGKRQKSNPKVDGCGEVNIPATAAAANSNTNCNTNSSSSSASDKSKSSGKTESKGKQQHKQQQQRLQGAQRRVQSKQKKLLQQGNHQQQGKKHALSTANAHASAPQREAKGGVTSISSVTTKGGAAKTPTIIHASSSSSSGSNNNSFTQLVVGHFVSGE